MGGTGFECEEAYRELVAMMSVVKDEDSLEWCFPEVARRWHLGKNFPLTPRMVAKKSNVRFWWIGDCGHEWEATVYGMVGSSVGGCPYCAGKKVSVEMSLDAMYPDIAAQWDKERNGTAMPCDIMPGSHRQVGWVCSCGHRWKAVVKNRTMNGTGCPKCARNHVIRRDVKYESEG